MAIFGPKPLEKCQFFDFLKLMILQPRKAFYRSRISLKTFSWPILPKNKNLDKWPFSDQKHGLTLLEKCQFFHFLTSYFYRLERRFFVLEYQNRDFSRLYCQKNKLEKWPFLDQNHGLTPLKKFQVFDFLNFLFLRPNNAFFRSRISLKTFSLAILPKKKKVGKMVIFRPKPWVNLFGKMSIFRLFGLPVFVAQKGVFLFQNIIKDIFQAYIA